MAEFKIPVVFHPIYSQMTLAKNHRFPIEKYQSLNDTAFHKYDSELQQHIVANQVTKQQLLLVHEPDYINEFISGSIAEKSMKRIGFPWSKQFVKRTLTAVAGTLKAGELAYQHGIAINLTGGYHHAHPSFGSGFCVFNDLVITAKHLLNQQMASRVLIFDCDVHQGDGSAVCAELDPNIFTLSLHCQKNFPTRKQSSDWDIGLEKELGDQDYLAEVNDALNSAIYSFRPDFIIYDAGVDIHAQDDLGLLNITTEGLFKRDQFVLSTAAQHQIPVLSVIGGGYQRDIAALTQCHMQLIDAAVSTFCKA